MADRGRGRTVVDAPVADVWEVVCDLEAYPSWAADIKHVAVLTRTPEGWPETAEFRVGGFGVSVGYSLRYDYEPLRSQSWELIGSSELRRMDGEYRFVDLGEGRTEVHYLLEVDLRIPVIGLVKRRAERTIIDHALRGLKAEVERSGRLR